MRHPSEWDGTAARDLEDAALRFIESAAVVKQELAAIDASTIHDLKLQFALRAALDALDMGFRIVTGEPLPQEYQVTETDAGELSDLVDARSLSEHGHDGDVARNN